MFFWFLVTFLVGFHSQFLYVTSSICRLTNNKLKTVFNESIERNWIQESKVGIYTGK